ncbi:MAG TPA: hypothetical protein VL225_10350 [Vicinamibacterales bacterium]|nr:hypothetical protein [Vicinamibacterales bacterium]
MSMKRMSSSLAAAVVICGMTAAAQTPQQPPTTTGDQKNAAAAPITVAGCVQQESAVLKRNPIAGSVGMGDEFVLTFASLNPGPATTTEPAPAEPVGTSGSPGNFGTVYRVTGDKEKELKSYVGQRVEVTGTFKDKEKLTDEASSVGAGGRELTPANTREITIESIKPVAGTCAPVIK